MASESLTFRQAREADVPAIVALVESAYRGDTSRAGWTTEADLLDGQRTDEAEIRSWLGRRRAVVLLAHGNGELLGSLVLSDQGQGRAYLGMFAVAPQSQGSGVGRAMLREAERRAHASFGAEKLRMTVIGQRSELIAWYTRCGFARTGEREDFPYGDARFGLPRRDDLYFEVLEKRLG
jgi:ribosomal protein S18 acetylase RimI-like enzyme